MTITAFRRYTADDYKYQFNGLYQLVGLSMDIIEGVLTTDPEQGAKLVNDYFLTLNVLAEIQQTKQTITGIVSRVLIVQEKYPEIARLMCDHLYKTIEKKHINFISDKTDLTIIDDDNERQSIFELMIEVYTVCFIEREWLTYEQIKQLKNNKHLIFNLV